MTSTANPPEPMEDRWLRIRTEDVDVPVEASDNTVVFSSVQSVIPGAHGLYYRENGVKKALKYDSLTGRVTMPACGWDTNQIFVEIAHGHGGCKQKGYLANYEAATKTFEQSVNMVHRLLAGAARPGLRRTPVKPSPQAGEEGAPKVEGAEVTAAEHDNRVNQETDRMQAYKMQKLMEENAHLKNKLNECKVTMENFDRQLRAKNDELRSLNAMFIQSGSVLESIEREKALLEGNVREYKTWLLEANHRIKGLELENDELSIECKQRVSSIDDQLLFSSTYSLPQRNTSTLKERPQSPTSFFNAHAAQLATKFPPAEKDTSGLDSAEKLRRLKQHFTLRPNRREIYHHCWSNPESGTVRESCVEQKSSPTKDSVSISETTESTIPVGGGEDKTIEEKVKRLEAVTSSMLQQNSEIQKNQIRIKKRVKDVLGKIGPTPGSPDEAPHSDSSDTTPQGAEKEEPLKVAPIDTIKKENLGADAWNSEENVEMNGKLCVISGMPEIDKNRLNLVILNQNIEPSSEHRRVWFEIDAPDAENVYLAGSFLNWEYALLCEKRPDKNTVGAWLDLPPGKYEFRFLVDGEWRTVDAYQKTELNALGARNNWRLVE